MTRSTWLAEGYARRIRLRTAAYRAACAAVDKEMKDGEIKACPPPCCSTCGSPEHQNADIADGVGWAAKRFGSSQENWLDVAEYRRERRKSYPEWVALLRRNCVTEVGNVS